MFTLDEVNEILRDTLKDAGSEYLYPLSEAFEIQLNDSRLNSETLLFGKYKGKTLASIVQDDPVGGLRYCRYIVNAKDKDDETVNWIQQAFPDLFEEAKIYLEKFKSKRQRTN
jgi:hypothetical protein